MTIAYLNRLNYSVCDTRALGCVSFTIQLRSGIVQGDVRGWAKGSLWPEKDAGHVTTHLAHPEHQAHRWVSLTGEIEDRYIVARLRRKKGDNKGAGAPTELRYEDVLKKISSLSCSLYETTILIGLAEQSDMHTSQKATDGRLEELFVQLSEIKRLVVEEHTINTSARIELRQDLTDIQLGQVISFLSTSTILDATKSHGSP
ncbi:hypothetical protein CIB48_g3894 [Xylaria polymorpha]|nr:hypothetical protein CIB48_g3894 [Xylaria polymorpha]